MVVKRVGPIVVMLVACLAAGSGLAEDEPNEAERQARREALKEHAVGGLAALNLYTTFGAIGLTADGFEGELYDTAKVERVMSDCLKTNALAVEMLKSAAANDDDIREQIPVDELIDSYYFLDREARMLVRAAKSGEKEDMQAFYQSREESWQNLKKVLGIQEPPAKNSGEGAKRGDE